MNNDFDRNMTQNDRKVLKELALRVAELAAGPLEEEKRRLWFRHNALEATRPVIFCDPENGWHEIFPEKHLLCKGDLARQWEFHLRKEIFWGESMGDDRVVEAVFNVPYVYANTGWGMKETIEGGGNGGAYHWDAPLKDYRDMEKLHFPEILIDREKTRHLVSLAQEVFGGILAVRLSMKWWWSLGITRTAVRIRGLEQILFDLYDYPEELHRLMAFIRDGQLAMLESLKKNRLLSLNNDGSYVGSGGFGWTEELPQKDFSGEVRTMDMWGFAESQETSQVSPQMFEEFVFRYELPILEKFGLNCYGCCEPINARWDIIKKTPRLRRVSVSPWADLSGMADKLGDSYIYSMKPTPTDLAMPQMDEAYIRSKLREAMQMTKNCRVEIIMKDNHTLGHNPQNVVKWCRIAREEAERI